MLVDVIYGATLVVDDNAYARHLSRL
jgi:hypothetical protein